MKMGETEQYEIVVGLEVHAQLLTNSKLFCGDAIAYGAEPNTQVSPITLGHPGTLPKMNRKAIEFAVKMGLACNCTIEQNNFFARKNYFYPDLPKGYQLSQHTTPICRGGHIDIVTSAGKQTIRLNRIHMEEDAGKSIHDADPEYTCVDFNRAGTPLIEIVSEPDIRSADEAFAYLTEIRKLVRYLEICDGNMEEGSLRCDANISVRKKGDTVLGTKVEVKNLNSIRNVKKAIEFEAARMIRLLEEGKRIMQQTRSFRAEDGTTFAIRDKEEADDYRYFADPDLTPFQLEDSFIEAVRQTIPPLQQERATAYRERLQLPEYDAYQLTEEKEMAAYFDRVILHTSLYKAGANWMLGPVRSWMNDTGQPITAFPVLPERLAALINLVDAGTINFSVASSRVFPVMVQDPAKNPEEIAARLNLIQDSDVNSIEGLVDRVLEKMPEKVKEFRKGKKGLMGLFVGEVIKLSKGKADPKLTNRILAQKLNEQS